MTITSKSLALDFATRFKAGPDAGLEQGEFVAYASVFGNVDSYGEVVQRGAFAESLAEWAKSDNPIPLLWGHNMADPDYNIGHIVEAVEDDHGLKVRAVIDMESPKAAQVYRLLKSGRVAQMSFAFGVDKESYVEPESQDNGDGTKTVTPGYWLLEKLSLYEVSVVPLGANQATEELAVKSAAHALAAQAGRISQERLKDAVAALDAARGELTAMLSADPGGDEDQDQTSGEGTAPEDATSLGEATPDYPSVSLALDALDADVLGVSA